MTIGKHNLPGPNNSCDRIKRPPPHHGHRLSWCRRQWVKVLFWTRLISQATGPQAGLTLILIDPFTPTSWTFWTRGTFGWNSWSTGRESYLHFVNTWAITFTITINISYSLRTHNYNHSYRVFLELSLVLQVVGLLLTPPLPPPQRSSSVSARSLLTP